MKTNLTLLTKVLWALTLIFLASTLYFANCALNGDKSASTYSEVETRQELVAFNDSFNSFAADYDVDGIVSLYDADALWIAPRTPPADGPETARQTFSFLVANQGSITHSIDHLFISDDGSQATMIWDAVIFVEKAGLDFTWTYQFVMEKQDDTWKIVSDMFNQHTTEDLEVTE